MLKSVANCRKVNGEVKALAVGYLSQIRSPNFLVMAHILRAILSTLQPANVILQGEKMNLADGVAVIESCTKVLQDMRHCESDAFELIWQRCDVVGDQLDLFPPGEAEASRPQPHSKRICKVNSRFADSVVMTPFGQNVQRLQDSSDSASTSKQDKFKSEMRRLFFSILDNALTEIDSRFGERSKPFVYALTGLAPGTGNFLDPSVLKPLTRLLNIDDEKLSCEISVAKPLIESRITETRLATFTYTNNAMQVLFPFRDAFPILYKVFASAVTFGASTAVCESSFSTLTRILTPYRRSMVHRRLSNLVLLAFEKAITDSLDGQQFLSKFRTKSRRLKI